MDIKDLGGVSKPLTRLIEVISKALGTVYEPYHIKRMADARTYEMLKISSANETVKRNGLQTSYENGPITLSCVNPFQASNIESTFLIERVNNRLNHQEIKRQQNIDNVVSYAIGELKNNSEVAEDYPDEDWVTRFFSHSQDISSEVMQQLWGKVLASEISSPGLYSLNTLDLLRNLTSFDAKLFQKFGEFALNSLNNSCYICLTNRELLMDEFKLTYGEYLHLVELGLINPQESNRQFRDSDKNEFNEYSFIYADKMFFMKEIPGIKPKAMPVWKFSYIGCELFHLLSKNYNPNYILYATALYKLQGFEITYSDITSDDFINLVCDDVRHTLE